MSKVDLPNGAAVEYDYAADKLAAVRHPDGTVSTFGFSVDPNTGHTLVAYDDPAAGGTHRRKTVALTSQLTGMPTAENGITVVNQASMLVRYVVNGEGELTYMNVSPPAGVDNPNTTIVYEGGGKARKYHAGWEEKHFADGWTFGDPADGYAAFQGTFETSTKVLGTSHDQLRRGNIPQVQDRTGRKFSFEYDAEYFPTKKMYQDGTFETWQYDAFKQITRHRDRLGRVSKAIYDARGNLLRRETGILEVHGVDAKEPECLAFKEKSRHPSSRFPGRA